MNPIFLLLAAAPLAGAADDTIVVTASRTPVTERDAAASVTVFDREEIADLGFPLTTDMLRLVPGVTIAASGPPGSQTQLRIRGAEAGHTLLFVDGIKFNDPAAGNEARFEMLTNDSLSRIELIRGPQSALWGSEALGGVVALETADARRAPGLSALAEYGSHDSKRAAGQFAVRTGDLALSGSAGWLESDGINAFSGAAAGDRDGFENKSASLKAIYAPVSGAEIGIVGHIVHSDNDYDGSDPDTFAHADTLDTTENLMKAGRVWAKYGWGDGWSAAIDGSLLSSSNRNRLAGEPLNATFGKRSTVSGQFGRTLRLGGTTQQLMVAVEHEHERFRAEDQQYFGATDQSRARSLTGYVGEWRAEWNRFLVTDVAVRHDDFSQFSDATTLRASVLVRLDDHWSLHGAYGEGIAQPTFYDLFGFFPGSFVGNPALTPEESNSWEAGVRWSDDRTDISLTGFTGRLKNEIVDIFNSDTFESSTANALGTSHRRGFEIAGARKITSGIRLGFNYTFLDADEQKVAGTPHIRESRRARHSGNVFASGQVGPVEFGASLAYVGKRLDTDFDSFPARTVRLHDYVLGSLDVGWRVTGKVTAYARMENAFDADYEDAFGYATPGRTIYAGLRLRLGD
jgi:vitamin B12 transporter